MPLAQIESNGTIYYIHNDHLGTPQKMTDASKSIVWDRIQKPFGETVSIAGTATGNLRFLGQYADTETPYLSQNGFRDYDTSLGGFPEADPIGLRGGINPYVYVKGNPLKWVDPKGENWLAPVVLVVFAHERGSRVPTF
jgi:RHS repeat-associated protein